MHPVVCNFGLSECNRVNLVTNADTDIKMTTMFSMKKLEKRIYILKTIFLKLSLYPIKMEALY